MDKENFNTSRKGPHSPSAAIRCPLSDIPVSVNVLDGINAFSAEPASKDLLQTNPAKKPESSRKINILYQEYAVYSPQCKSKVNHGKSLQQKDSFRQRLYGVSCCTKLCTDTQLHSTANADQNCQHVKQQQAQHAQNASKDVQQTTPANKSGSTREISIQQCKSHISHENLVQRSGPFRQRLYGVSSRKSSCLDTPFHPADQHAKHQLKQQAQHAAAVSQESNVGGNFQCMTQSKSAPVVTVSRKRSTFRNPFQSNLLPIPEEDHVSDSLLCNSFFPPVPPAVPSVCEQNAESPIPQTTSIGTEEGAKSRKYEPPPPLPAVIGLEAAKDAIQTDSTGSQQIVVNGRAYTILSLLGQGSSSKVFQVLDPDNSQPKAVKCVNLADTDQSVRDLYLNEIKLLSDLQGADCVIRMFDYEYLEKKDMLFVVMEKGDTDLSKLIKNVRKSKKISAAMIIYYWTEMLNAVNYIHKRCTIHSDLKPANFLLVSGRLKLIDFGIASSVQADMTSVVKDILGGTFNYISPEALLAISSEGAAFRISYKSDVWSLGCILYSLIYGLTPFHHISDIPRKITAIVSPDHKIQFPNPPIEGCSNALTQALKMSLVRNPKERASVDELLQLPYLGYIGPERGILYPVARLVASVGTVQESEDNPYAAVVRSIQRLILENKRQLSFLGSTK